MIRERKRSLLDLPKIIIIICAGLTVLFIFGLSRELVNRHKIVKQIDSLSDQMKQLQDQNGQLQELIGSLQGNDFIEKEARLKLGLQKPGERVALIKRAGDDSQAAQVMLDGAKVSGNFIDGATLEPDELPNPIKWWKYFFKNSI